jgi:hypothetical protein
MKSPLHVFLRDKGAMQSLFCRMGMKQIFKLVEWKRRTSSVDHPMTVWAKYTNLWDLRDGAVPFWALSLGERVEMVTFDEFLTQLAIPLGEIKSTHCAAIAIQPLGFANELRIARKEVGLALATSAFNKFLLWMAGGERTARGCCKEAWSRQSQSCSGA